MTEPNMPLDNLDAAQSLVQRAIAQESGEMLAKAQARALIDIGRSLRTISDWCNHNWELRSSR